MIQFFVLILALTSALPIDDDDSYERYSGQRFVQPTFYSSFKPTFTNFRAASVPLRQAFSSFSPMTYSSFRPLPVVRNTIPGNHYQPKVRTFGIPSVQISANKIDDSFEDFDLDDRQIVSATIQRQPAPVASVMTYNAPARQAIHFPTTDNRIMPSYFRSSNPVRPIPSVSTYTRMESDEDFDDNDSYMSFGTPSVRSAVGNRFVSYNSDSNEIGDDDSTNFASFRSAPTSYSTFSINDDDNDDNDDQFEFDD